MSQRVTPYELFILALSIWAILGLAAQSTFALSPATAQILDYADLCVCSVFLLDFAHSLYVAPDRWRYLRTWGWLDLLSSIPAIDALRWGRTARVLRILRVLRGLKSARAIIRFVMQRRSQSAFLAAILLCLALVTTSSIAILQFEVQAGGNIQTAQDAVWWSLSTMSTLGYGDVYPTTPEGRLIAIFLMAAGVGVFGTMAGLLARWFLTEDPEDTGEFDEIHAALVRMNMHLEVLRHRATGAAPTDGASASPGRMHGG